MWGVGVGDVGWRHAAEEAPGEQGVASERQCASRYAVAGAVGGVGLWGWRYAAEEATVHLGTMREAVRFQVCGEGVGGVPVT